jgi:hypothetical protein
MAHARTFPFLRHTLLLSRSLIRLHQRLRGEIAKTTGVLILTPRAKTAVIHIERLLAFIGVNFCEGALRPVIISGPVTGVTSRLGKPITMTARSLIRLHMRLRGELHKAKIGERPLLAAHDAKSVIRSIEWLLEFFEVDFDPTVLCPVLTRSRRGPFGHGGLRRNIVITLRRSDRWMTYKEIVQALIAAHELKFSHPDYRRFLQKVREALYVMKVRGRVKPKLSIGLKDGRTRQLWRLRARLADR